MHIYENTGWGVCLDQPKCILCHVQTHQQDLSTGDGGVLVLHVYKVKPNLHELQFHLLKAMF